jgi:hypothetical protein
VVAFAGNFQGADGGWRWLFLGQMMMGAAFARAAGRLREADRLGGGGRLGHNLNVTARNDPNALRVASVGAWLASGLSRYELARLIDTGDLVRVRYGTYAKASVVAAAAADPVLAHALDVAGAIARQPLAVASHQSAATLRGLDLLNRSSAGAVCVTVPPGARAGSYRQADVIRHSAALPDTHVTSVCGVPTTTAARTVVDIARSGAFMAGVVTADSALYQRRTSKTELRRVLASCDGWPGIVNATRVVDFADSSAESVLESCARVVFHDQGLPPPELQVMILGQGGSKIARVDFLWRDCSVVAEADGLLKYQTGADAIAELKRDRLLREQGLDVIHFTWEELFREPERVVRRLLTAFDHGRRLRQPPA